MLSLLFALLQATPQADTRFLFASEKIYTVLSVLLLIWVGIVAMLLMMNRRLTKLEQKLDKKA